jgi:hypothetical protein
MILRRNASRLGPAPEAVLVTRSAFSIAALCPWSWDRGRNKHGLVETDKNGDPKYYELIRECFVYTMMEG